MKRLKSTISLNYLGRCGVVVWCFHLELKCLCVFEQPTCCIVPRFQIFVILPWGTWTYFSGSFQSAVFFLLHSSCSPHARYLINVTEKLVAVLTYTWMMLRSCRYDKYPKAKHHLLVLPRRVVRSARDLDGNKSADVQMLKEMNFRARWIIDGWVSCRIWSYDYVAPCCRYTNDDSLSFPSHLYAWIESKTTPFFSLFIAFQILPSRSRQYQVLTSIDTFFSRRWP